MIRIASYSREALYCKLEKSRRSFGKLKRDLSASPADAELLDSATGYKIDDLQRKRRQANKKKESLAKEVEETVLAADKREFALARASARWTLVATRGEVSKYISKLESELKTIEQLYKLLEAKGNLYQAQNIENLHQNAQIVLRGLVKRSLGLLQDRHAKIRAKAPRYSFHVDPVIYQGESSGTGHEYRVEQRTAKIHTEGTRAEVSKSEPFYSRFVMKRPL